MMRNSSMVIIFKVVVAWVEDVSMAFWFIRCFTELIYDDMADMR